MANVKEIRKYAKRRRVVNSKWYGYFAAHEGGYYKLTLSCGHTKNFGYSNMSSNIPKTTFCYKCGEIIADEMATIEND
jgi:hypothetical protein